MLSTRRDRKETLFQTVTVIEGRQVVIEVIIYFHIFEGLGFVLRLSDVPELDSKTVPGHNVMEVVFYEVCLTDSLSVEFYLGLRKGLIFQSEAGSVPKRRSLSDVTNMHPTLGGSVEEDVTGHRVEFC